MAVGGRQEARGSWKPWKLYSVVYAQSTPAADPLIQILFALTIKQRTTVVDGAVLMRDWPAETKTGDESNPAEEKEN